MDYNTKTKKLNEIEKEIKICQRCGLCKTANNAVPGEGDPNTEIVFIGEAPGRNEDMQGRPFVGRAGMLLEFMLGQINLKREKVWIGNIIKHRPPDNRDPLPNEISECKSFLTRQLEIISPKIIITLGRFAMNYFLPDAKISDSHGVAFPINGMLIYPVYHPAAALRNPKMKLTLMKDFLRIPDIIKESSINKTSINIGDELDLKNIVRDSSSKQTKLF